MSSERHKILRVGVAQPVLEWDPHHAQDAGSHLVLAQLYETPFAQLLVGERPEPILFDGPLEPVVGASRSRQRGTIRAARHFCDGTAVTADLVAQSLARSDLLAQSVDVRAEGDAVIFDSDRPRPRLDVALAKRWCAVTLTRQGRFFGTGAFMRSPEQDGPNHVTLVRNPHHHRPVALDAIVFEHFGPGRDDELAAALQAGRVHLTQALDGGRAAALRRVSMVTRPGASTGALFFNVERPALASVEVRRALASAIDRYKLTRIAYPDAAGLTAKGLVPPVLGKHRDGHRFDRAAAAGLGDRRPASLRMLVVWAPRSYLPDPPALAAEIMRMFAAVGVGVETVFADSSHDYTRRLRAGDYDLVLGGWIAETDEPGDFYESLTSSAAIPTEGASTSAAGNFSRWSDPTTDELLERYRDGGQASVLERIADRVAAEVPLLPLMYGASVVSYSDRLRNFVPTGAYVPSFAGVDLAAPGG